MRGFGYRPSETGKFNIYFKDFSNMDDAFEKDHINTFRGFSLDSILHINGYSRYPVQTVDRIKTSDADESCVIRNWIYKILEDDMEKIFKDNDD